MAKIERYTFVNNRARLQRLSDAKLFAGWVRELNTTHLFLRPSIPSVCEHGDSFFVEIHGGGRNATFRATFEVMLGQDLIFNIVSAIQFGSSNENVRQAVNGMSGSADFDGNSVTFTVVDVSEGGVGLLMPVQIAKGAFIEMVLQTPQGEVRCSGTVRYSRTDATKKGYFRTGVAFEPMQRLERARWQRVMERTAA